MCVYVLCVCMCLDGCASLLWLVLVEWDPIILKHIHTCTRMSTHPTQTHKHLRHSTAHKPTNRHTSTACCTTHITNLEVDLDVMMRFNGRTARTQHAYLSDTHTIDTHFYETRTDCSKKIPPMRSISGNSSEKNTPYENYFLGYFCVLSIILGFRWDEMINHLIEIQFSDRLLVFVRYKCVRSGISQAVHPFHYFNFTSSVFVGMLFVIRFVCFTHQYGHLWVISVSACWCITYEHDIPFDNTFMLDGCVVVAYPLQTHD